MNVDTYLFVYCCFTAYSFNLFAFALHEFQSFPQFTDYMKSHTMKFPSTYHNCVTYARPNDRKQQQTTLILIKHYVINALKYASLQI